MENISYSKFLLLLACIEFNWDLSCFAKPQLSSLVSLLTFFIFNSFLSNHFTFTHTSNALIIFLLYFSLSTQPSNPAVPFLIDLLLLFQLQQEALIYFLANAYVTIFKVNQSLSFPNF